MSLNDEIQMNKEHDLTRSNFFWRKDVKKRIKEESILVAKFVNGHLTINEFLEGRRDIFGRELI